MKYEKVLPTQPLHRKPEDFPKGDLLFNIGLIDLFYECEENNMASYSCTRDTQTAVSSKLFHRFQFNHLKVSPGKCHLLLSSKTPTDVSTGDGSIKANTKETLLGILID